MTEFDDSPTAPGMRGLPRRLPPGERILWQGAPAPRLLARGAFHTRLVAGYFLLLAGWAIAAALGRGTPLAPAIGGAAVTLAVGAAGFALLHLLAWAAARSSVYTLTDRRLVLRIGVAVPKSINIPLAQIAAVDLARRADGSGDVALRLRGVPRLGWLALWPHARGWRIVRPEPVLRALADVDPVAALLARHCAAASAPPAPRPAPVLAVAA